MTHSQIIPLLVYVVVVFIYLWISTKFEKGWPRHGIAVKGGKLNILVVAIILFIVLALLVKTTVK